jgi:hypothetical protein
MLELTVGQLISLAGRLLRVSGFDPMGVSSRQVELEDCKTGELCRVPLDELERNGRADVAAA